MKKIAMLICFLFIFSVVSFAQAADILTYEDYKALENSQQDCLGKQVKVLAKFLNYGKVAIGGARHGEYGYSYSCDVYLKSEDGSFKLIKQDLDFMRNAPEKYCKMGDGSHYAFREGLECVLTLKLYGNLSIGEGNIVSIESTEKTAFRVNTVITCQIAALLAVLFAICIWILKLDNRRKEKKSAKTQSLLEEFERMILYTELVNVSTDITVYSNQRMGEVIDRAWIGKKLGGDLGAFVGAATTPPELDIRTGDETYTFFVRGKDGSTITDHVKADNAKFAIYVSKMR